MKHSTAGRIDIYPVGVLAVLLGFGRAVRARHPQAVRASLTRIRGEVRYLRGQAKAGNWRAVRNAFGGYHAEQTPARGTRCGHAWTKRRALLDLYRHLLGEL